MSLWQKLINLCFYAWAITIPLVFLTNTSELFELPKFLLTCVIAIFILVFWLLRCISEKKLVFRRTPLDIPILIFVICNLVTLYFSTDRNLSWWGYYSRLNGGVLSWLIYSLLYWSAVSNLDQKSTLKIVYCALSTAALVSLWAIFEAFGHSFSCRIITSNFDVACWTQKVQDRVFASLGQPNWLASYLLALLFMPLSKILKSKFENPNKNQITKPQNSFKFLGFSLYLDLSFLNLVFVTIMLLALWFTHSRSGFLALGTGSIIYAGFTYSKKLLWLLLPVFLVVTIYTLTLSRSSTLPNSGTESIAIRINNVWLGGFKAWLHSPKTILLGWGPETFHIAYALYRSASHNLTTEWQETYNKAHNEYLNTLTTTGLLGLVAYLYLLFSIYKIFRKNLSTEYLREERTNGSTLSTAMLSGWTTLLVTNFWGFSVTLTNTLLLLLPVFAITSYNQTAAYKPLTKSRYLFLFLLVPLCLCAFVPLVKFFLADLSLAHSRRSTHPLTSYESAYLAYTLNPSEPTVTSELAYSSAFLSAALQDKDASLSAQFAQTAISASDHSLSQSPHNPSLYRLRARTFILLSQTQSAIDSLSIARLLAPTDPRIPALLYQLTKEEKYQTATLLLKPDYQF